MARKGSYYSRYKREARKAIKRAPKWALVLAFVLAVVCVLGYFVYDKYFKNQPLAVGEFSVHFLSVGHKNNGDCIYVKAGDKDILIDAGSEPESVPTIRNYINRYVTDGKLEFVIVTHADYDHIAGFECDDNIFEYYQTDIIIDFPKTNKADKTAVINYYENLQKEVNAGATHYTALECYKGLNGAQSTYELSESIYLDVLYNYYYENVSSSENNYSVCVQFRHGGKKFLFTGDLESSGESKLVDFYENEFSQVELYKAGHHGSKTSSTLKLLNKIRPKICVVPCTVGYDQYNSNPENVFPSQSFVDNISNFTDKVYATQIASSNSAGYELLNGNVIVSSSAEKVEVICTASSILLKDTDWFKQNRA